MRNMKLYLVYGNTCFEGYGCSISLFGVFTTREKAKKVKTTMEEKYFHECMEDELNYIDRSDVEFKIREINANYQIDEYLGGYVE